MALRNILRQIKYRIKCRRIFTHDYKHWAKYLSGSSYSLKNGSEAARDILVYCHMVEKGLSHKNLKPLFGLDRVKMISEKLTLYQNVGGADPFIIGMAVNTLEKYCDINRSLGVTENQLPLIPIANKTADQMDVGIIDVDEKTYYADSQKAFSFISKSRHSVRLYDCKSLSVSRQEVMNCINIALNCPSACNRQGVRLKIILDEYLIRKICDIQGGSRGFGENSGALIIVTSDLTLYEPFERRIPMLDCGIFIMNLTYALYEQKLGSCVLNGSFTIEREKRMKALIPIPENEEFAAVIAVSKIPEGESIRFAKSNKRNVKSIVSIYE